MALPEFVVLFVVRPLRVERLRRPLESLVVEPVELSIEPEVPVFVPESLVEPAVPLPPELVPDPDVCANAGIASASDAAITIVFELNFIKPPLKLRTS